MDYTKSISDNNPNAFAVTPETVTPAVPAPVEPTNTNATPYSTDTWAEKALSTVWDAARKADSADLTKNSAAKSLEDLFSSSGQTLNFTDTLQEFIDQGFNTEEATAKAAETLKTKIDDSTFDEGKKAEAYKYLEEAVKPSADQDPSSFEFFMSQFKETDEGKAILQEMYHGQNEYVASNQFDQLKDDTLKQSNLLDNLLEQSQTNTGLFSPISMTIGGKEVSFVPRMARERAAFEANLGQEKVANSASLFASGLGLDKIIQDAAQFKASDQNVDQNREAQEPGTLDYIKAVPVVGGLIGGIADIFGW